MYEFVRRPISKSKSKFNKTLRYIFDEKNNCLKFQHLNRRWWDSSIWPTLSSWTPRKLRARASRPSLPGLSCWRTARCRRSRQPSTSSWCSTRSLLLSSSTATPTFKIFKNLTNSFKKIVAYYILREITETFICLTNIFLSCIFTIF